jgi:hypothetical protein
MIKNVLLALLALTTVVLATFALRRPAPLGTSANGAPLPSRTKANSDPTAAAEAARPDPAATDLARVREDNRRLDALVRELRDEISVLQAGRSPGPGALRGAGNPPLPVPRAILDELLGRPETVKLAMDWIRADITPRYASLIALQTQLNDDQREQLLSLLAERYASRMDLAAVGNGSLTPDYHAKLVQLVGDDSAALFEKSEVKPVSWDRMQRLDERLRYEATPLNQQQYTALWPILSEAVFYYHAPATSTEAEALIQQRIDGNQKALAQAASQLNPAQMKTLSRLLDDDLATWRVQLYTMTNLQQTRPMPVPSTPPAPSR